MYLYVDNQLIFLNFSYIRQCHLIRLSLNLIWISFVILQDKMGKDAHVSGVRTQGENIADNGGVREAFRAYHMYLKDKGDLKEKKLPGLGQYSSDQLFFMSFARVWCTLATDEHLQDRILTDPHSPGPIRVLGTMSNSEDFSRAFNCPNGSTYNPKDKCVLW